MIYAARFRFFRGFILTAILVLLALYFRVPFTKAEAVPQNSQVTAGSLTGNWAIKTPRNDGTFSKLYFNLKQDGGKITGTIRSTQFYYQISESSGDADGFTFTGSMKDGNNNRTVKYEGKLVGDELHLSTRRRPEDKPTESVARRVPDGEGAMLAKLPLPALHKV